MSALANMEPRGVYTIRQEGWADSKKTDNLVSKWYIQIQKQAEEGGIQPNFVAHKLAEFIIESKNN
jgi:hypothetical protein